MMNQPGFGRVTRDVVDLVELQLQLLAVDGQVAKRKAIQAVVCAAVAITLCVSTLTTILLGVGFLFHENLEWSVGASLMAVAVASLVIVTVMLVAATLAIRSAAAAMGETKSEFAENLRWLKGILISPDSSPRHQIRKDDFEPYRPNACTHSDQRPVRRTQSRFENH
ncbi:MAG: phage holin family protein [Planctomycetales bacterium]|nr:phage holin family protein [Planctomycetales bacterium]